MSASEKNMNWQEANQSYLSAALASVRALLERHAESPRSGRREAKEDKKLQQSLQEASADMPAPAALETLCQKFGLSSFERNVLLLCAGMELEASFAALCMEASGDPQRPYPTFSLALAALPEAYWSAITPAATLRRWRLIDVGAGESLTLSPLRIDERILHYLAGTPHLDDRLAELTEPVHSPMTLLPSQQKIADQLAKAWKDATKISELPVVQLCGEEVSGKRAIAAAGCAQLGFILRSMPARVLPTAPSELEAFIRLWEREAALYQSALLLDCEEVDLSDVARRGAINRALDGLVCPMIVMSHERRFTLQRKVLAFDVPRPTATEQRNLWKSMLGAAAPVLNGHVEAMASQFSLSAQTIQSICAEAMAKLDESGPKIDPNDPPFSVLDPKFPASLWEACRQYTRPRLENLAQHLEPVVDWDDLVLPEQQIRTLHEVAAHVRQRAKVYETWGFVNKGTRGLGISVLFAGASGTGKTMAAEVLAKQLRLDLYRIDLSQVVNKYIGETEKNLRRVFDAAEEGGAILLFDEAEALFGKRSEVKDSHDRYANIEIGYLLQRMEAYRGLAILTTNMKQALDSAFMRRIRFIVQFPFPDAGQRAEIWRRIFPPATPTEGMDINKLAQLNVPGGNIRNIALNAAFLAADANEPVRMPHILRAARSEYGKMEKSLTDAEVRGWVG